MTIKLSTITSGTPYRYHCDRHGWIPAESVRASHETGGDWDETLTVDRCECGMEAFSAPPTFIGHRRPAKHEPIIRSNAA